MTQEGQPFEGAQTAAVAGGKVVFEITCNRQVVSCVWKRGIGIEVLPVVRGAVCLQGHVWLDENVLGRLDSKATCSKKTDLNH